ncbi:hypothetical protein CEXT_75431 [Caerostris extrusa]|uniref:Uncharacterized protein n=1 Tax=Caerostris extrusa TaxID=172846 RepID=A0AAV4NEX6_CAEEX|nr:hypothetical protein CEXT_75431 [Caerostris extrusa]
MTGERCLIAEGPPIPSPLSVRVMGPLGMGSNCPTGSLPPLSTSSWTFLCALGKRSSSLEPPSEKGIVSRAFPRAPVLKEIDSR